MANRHKSSTLVHRGGAPGPVLDYKLQEVSPGIQVVSIQLDYTNAPVPSNYYIADFYHLSAQGPDALFVFGKLDFPASNKLRNRLELLFPAMAFVNQLWASSREFEKTLAQQVAERAFEPVAPGTVEMMTTTDKVHTVHANNVAMALSGFECLLDFFRLSPRDVALKTRRHEPLELEPIVRVLANPPLVLGLLQECDALAEHLKPQYELRPKEQTT